MARTGCGGLLLALSGLCGLLYLVSALMAVGDPAAEALALMTGAGAALCALGGAVALWSTSVPATAGTEAEIAPRVRIAGWAALFVGTLVLGGAVIRLGPVAAAFALPPLHFAAALVPVLALTGRLVWRTRLTRIVYGSCGAASVALVLEGLIAGAVIAAAVYFVSRTPDGRATLSRLQDAIVGAGGTQGVDAQAIMPTLLQPIPIAVAVLLLGVLGPAIEEVAKVLGIAARTPRTARQAWLQGTAIGAGFGLTEAIALGATGIAGWPGTMTVRATATVMHATMTGLAAVGWFELAQPGRRRLGAAGLATAIVGHGAWNTMVLVTVLASAASAASAAPWLSALAGASASGLVLLWCAILTGYMLITARLKPELPPI